MKYINITLNFRFLAIITSILIFATSCDMNDPTEGKFGDNPNSGWIQFIDGETSSEVFDDAGAINIPIQLNAPLNDNDLIVTYKTELLSGTSTHDFGTYQTTILDTPENVFMGNIVFDAMPTSTTYEVKITLLNTDNSDVRVGLSDDSKPIEYILKVCSTSIDTNYTGVPTAFNNDFNSFSTTLTPTANDNEYAIGHAWGSTFVSELTNDPADVDAFDYDGILLINADYSITITGNAAWATGGTGNYDPCTKTFTYNLTQGLFGNPFTTDVVLIAD